MSLAPEQEAEIRRLHQVEHWPVGTIARQLRVHPDAVRRVLGKREPAAERAPRPRALDAYRAFVADTLTRYPSLRATRVFDMLRERGFAGSARSVRRFVAEVRPARVHEAYLRVESLPGEQAQVDWALVGKLPVPGGERAVWAFVMVLGYSRAMWAEVLFDLSAHALCRSLVRAVSFFGGSTRSWLFDNAKSVVTERYGTAYRFTPALVDLAGRLAVQPDLCAVRRPEHKGKVERAIRYLRDRFFAGRTLVSLERTNAELLCFFEQVAHARPHPTLPGKTVAQVFAEEKPHLLRLPEVLPATELAIPVYVDKTASVHFDGNSYSVPPRFAQKTLVLIADELHVRLDDGAAEVARHLRCWGKRARIEDPAHRQALWDQRRAAQPSVGRDRLRAQVPRFDELLERWVHAGYNVGSCVARALLLLDRYGADALIAATDIALEHAGTADVGALGQACEQRRRAQRAPMPVDVPLGDHVPDRDVIPHSLEDYDADPEG